MSYQVLARKWRPKSFEELVGQKQTAKALINALESQRLHHAYLFTGTRGVGKTTIARILSKSLNCEIGITSKPCGRCSTCLEIDQGNFVDLMEIDAASKTKVEDTRELLDNVQYRPTRGRYKVYLIDEVHMLSGHSFNALLKTLEEPPPHVIFLLATTDPQKLPVTVLSRCLQFHLKRMEEPQIIEHLSMILGAEEIQFEEKALIPIAKGADGSMRDALSLLDQAIAYCDSQIELASVLEMLGSIDQSFCLNILDAIQQDDSVQLMAIIQDMAQYSPDYIEVMSDWLSLLHKIAVAQATEKSDDEKIKVLAKSISPADLQLYYQLSLQAKKDLPFAPHPRQGFEMALLRVLAFKPLKLNLDNVKKKLNSLPQQEKKSAENYSSKEKKEEAEISVKETALKEPTLKKIVVEETNIREITEPLPQNITNNVQAEKLKEAQSDVETTVIQTSNEMDDSSEVKRLYPQQPTVLLKEINYGNWHFTIDQMSIGGNALQILLNSMACYENSQLTINYLTHVKHLLTDNIKQSLLNQLKQYFNSETQLNNNQVLNISLVEKEELPETPKLKQIKKHQAEIDQAFVQLNEDPCVIKLQQALSATFDKQSICLNIQ